MQHEHKFYCTALKTEKSRGGVNYIANELIAFYSLQIKIEKVKFERKLINLKF